VTHNLPENLLNFEFSKNEGIQSILTLLNLIPDPAIIFHAEENEILVANNPLYLLTNLGENDFIGQSIKTLLPNISDTDPISGHDRKALLRHKKQPLIPVIVHIYTLTKTKDLRLLIFKPEDFKASNKQVAADQADLIEKLFNTFAIKGTEEFETALQKTLVQMKDLLNADVVSLYKASGTNPQLIRFLESSTDLPLELPDYLRNDDLVNSQEADLWTPRRPALTQLQKVITSAEFKYLLTIPLGRGSTKFGLFVACGKEPNPPESTLVMGKMFAAYISGLMEDHVALQNARHLAARIRQVVKIQNEIVSNLEEGVIILSPDLTIAEINPAAETILGYANVEALRQHIDSILIGSESLGSALTSAQQGIPTLTGGDLTLHHRNGKSFPAQVMMAPVMNNHQLLSIIILIRDMSEQKKSQAANQQLEQRAILGEVTAIFAHEVRNPINAIMLSIQVMEENLCSDDENMKWIENIRDECNKLMYLMESVLSFAKPLEYKMVDVNLDDILPRILERWHPRFLRLNIASYYESTIANPIVEGDPRALEQVFTNLISNGANAMSDEGGSLGIKISEAEQEQDQNFYQITLTDSGHGIPDEIRAHLFTPFVTGTNRGTGLGLAITQRIINAHKGKIEVESFTGGTIFKIYLGKKKGNTTQ